MIYSHTIDFALFRCQGIDSIWYLGDSCAYPIQKTAFYAGLSATLAFLLVTVGAMAAYVLINKQRQTQ